MSRLNLWDAVGLAMIGLFVTALTVRLGQTPDESLETTQQLSSQSTDVQLGDEWLGLFFKGERVGLAHLNKARSSDGGYLYDSTTTLRLVAFGIKSRLDARISAQFDAALNLGSIQFKITAGPAKFEGQAIVEDRAIKVTLGRGTPDRTITIPVDTPPVLRHLVGVRLRKENLVVGQTLKIPIFDPMTQGTQTMEIEVVGRDEITILDQTFPATHIRQKVSGLVLNGWINERGEMLKQELGLGLVAVRETKVHARAGTLPSVAGADLISATMIKVNGLPKRLGQTERLDLALSGADVADFALNDQRQTWKEGRLSIRREKVGAGAVLPVDAVRFSKDLAAEPLIQSDDPQVKAIAKTIVGDAPDTVTAARRIMAWLAKNLTQTPIAGIPSAVDILDTKAGDCNEFSTLFVALARASGVPARLVVGLVYKDGYFGYHAWNEVWTSAGWLSLDATWFQFPVDVGHIALLRGGLAKQLRLLPIMGRLRMTVLGAQ
ncbi:MAG: transglutaminase-like domain-containing protein [Myxococcota bacterium]|nr:transglutaminase-like domain-containing protein [Myxococcota bacterium]